MQTLEMELFFDTWDTDSVAKQDVREQTGRVVNLLDIDRDLHAPPVLRVQWGSLDFRCVLARANQKFLMFADDGRPVRARVDGHVQRVHRRRARGEGGQPADRRLHEVPRRHARARR